MRGTVATEAGEASASTPYVTAPAQLRKGLPVPVGFAPREAVEWSAKLLGGLDGDLGGHQLRDGTIVDRFHALTPDLTKRHRLVVSPGSIQLRVLDQPEGWELQEPEPKKLVEQLVLDDELGPVQTCVEQLPAKPSAWWSPRSRARMVRVLSTLDWGPLLLARGCNPALVTLTYPGDWKAAAPSSAASKKHLDTFSKRLRRLCESNGIDQVRAVWKLEFQRRGAPHFHLYMPVPVGRIEWKCSRWCQGHSGTFQQWLSSTWASIVRPDPPKGGGLQLLGWVLAFGPHLRAGTGVDFSEGSRMSDPKRLAVYFTRHNAKGSRDKAYQHRVPEGWGGAGRWWGTWGMERLTVEVEVEAWELVEARRLLRRWIESQRVKGRPRLAPRQVRRGIASTGERRYRQVTRRYRVESLHHSLGGFVVTNDGPALAGMVARWLNAERERRAPEGPPVVEKRGQLEAATKAS